MAKKTIVFFIIFLVMAALVAGCSPGAKNTAPEPTENMPSVYTVADNVGDWGFPAPYSHYLRGPGYIRMSLIFDTLVWKDENGIKGLLAEKWHYDQEQNMYSFSLRKDVRWHDGKKLTAEDIAFTFDFTKRYPYPWCDTSIVEKVEAEDDYTVKIFLKEAYAPFLTNIAGCLPIIPKHIYQNVENPSNFKGTKAVTGTGPFKLLDYNKEHGTYLYEANENYYLGKPRVDRIRFVKVSGQMIPAALQKGTVNAGEIPPEVVSKFQQNFKVLSSGHDWNAKLIFNHNIKPFCEKEFRQAVAYAIDRNRLVKISQRGHALAGSPGMLPPDSFWYAPEIKKYEFNPELSRKMLKKLGCNQQNFEILTTSRFSRDAELIKEDLEKVGLIVSIRSLEDKTLDARIEDWDFQMAINGHGGLNGDPQCFNKFVLGGDFNSVRYRKNEELVAMLEKQLSIMNDERRREVVREIQEVYAAELPALTLYYPNWHWAHDGKVGLYYTPGGVSIGIPVPLNKLAFLEGHNVR